MKLWSLLFVMLLLSSVSVLGVPGQEDNNSNVGIPQRVALVEKVLEVEKLTKQPQAEVLGTDYIPNDMGKLQAYLKVGEYPLESAVCHVSVLYPNMTYFIENQLMMSATPKYFEGLYYLDFLVPNVTGVYPVNAICYYDAEIITSYPYQSYSDIPVGKPKGITIDAGSLTDLEVIDGITMDLKGEGDCNDFYCNHTFNFSLPDGWHTDTITDHRMIIQLEQDNNDEVKEFYIKANGGEYFWFNLTSKNVVENYQFDLNDTFSNITSYSLVLRSYDWDGGKVKIDYLATSRTYNGSYVSDLRGNSELVVSDGLFNLTVTVADFVESEISVVPDFQLEQIIIIIVFFVLIFAGYLVPASMLGLAYSFIYLDGLFTLVGAGICALILYGGWKNRKNK